MPRRAFAYDLSLPTFRVGRDIDFQRAPKDVREMVLKWLLLEGIKAKDSELAAGLDKNGVPLIPIAPKTREYRDSAMGQADPAAPPLMPAYAVSRTRLLLTGETYGNGARFFWEYDPNTGDTWGRILDLHRRGIGRGHRIKRDVIGLSPQSRAVVDQKLWDRWMAFKLAGLRAPVRPRQEAPRPQLPPPRIRVIGRTDFEQFTYGIGGGGAEQSRRALAAGYSTGFYQRRPGQGLPAYGGPGTAER